MYRAERTQTQSLPRGPNFGLAPDTIHQSQMGFHARDAFALEIRYLGIAEVQRAGKT
jgi:hypothetical protein